MSPKPRRRRGQEGFALIAGGLALVAMFALIVVAIDIGRISHTATEVQAIADSIYHELAPALMPAARENVRAHLEKLRDEGRAVEDHDAWRPWRD